MAVCLLVWWLVSCEQFQFLPPANEVWGKVMFLHLSVHRGVCLQGGLHPEGLSTGGSACGWVDQLLGTRNASSMHPTGMLSSFSLISFIHTRWSILKYKISFKCYVKIFTSYLIEFFSVTQFWHFCKYCVKYLLLIIVQIEKC